MLLPDLRDTCGGGEGQWCTLGLASGAREPRSAQFRGTVASYVLMEVAFG